MSESPILRKLKSLARLAESDNEHEAALALAKMTALMDEYSISEAEINSADPSNSPSMVMEEVLFIRGNSCQTWEWDLASLIARVFSTQVLRQKARRRSRQPGRYLFYGETTDVEVSTYAFVTLRSLLEDMAFKATQARNTKLKQEGFDLRRLPTDMSSKRYRTSWLLGALSTLSIESHKVVDDRSEGLYAIVSLKSENARAYMEQIAGPIQQVDSTPSLVDVKGFVDGARAGRDLSLIPGLSTQHEEAKLLP